MRRHVTSHPAVKFNASMNECMLLLAWAPGKLSQRQALQQRAAERTGRGCPGSGHGQRGSGPPRAAAARSLNRPFWAGAPVVGAREAAMGSVEAIHGAQQEQQPRVGAGVLAGQRRPQRVALPARGLAQAPPAHHPAWHRAWTLTQSPTQKWQACSEAGRGIDAENISWRRPSLRVQVTHMLCRRPHRRLRTILTNWRTAPRRSGAPTDTDSVQEAAPRVWRPFFTPTYARRHAGAARQARCSILFRVEGRTAGCARS